MSSHRHLVEETVDVLQNSLDVSLKRKLRISRMMSEASAQQIFGATSRAPSYRDRSCKVLEPPKKRSIASISMQRNMDEGTFLAFHFSDAYIAYRKASIIPACSPSGETKPSSIQLTNLITITILEEIQSASTMYLLLSVSCQRS
jgi:hypothetical protein